MWHGVVWESVYLLRLVSVSDGRGGMRRTATASLTVICATICALLHSVLPITFTHVTPTDEKLIQQWAPLVFLAPGEKFYPSSVPEFLEHVLPIPLEDPSGQMYDQISINQHHHLPEGTSSESWSLVTKQSVGDLLKNGSSFLYGRNPSEFRVPVYAIVDNCNYQNNSDAIDNNISSQNFAPHFIVSYWMFYPYNQGKAVCTVDMGRLGSWPIPKLNDFCWGAVKEFGNHVGDWEHFTLYFKGSYYPKKMYVSSHDVGAIYRYVRGEFVFERQEIRKGILQRASFPTKITLSSPGERPVLFSAKGSHGLWAAPGKHRFVRLPRLYDRSGYGSAWKTWRSLVILQRSAAVPRGWLRYRGRWGNPKSQCHPVSSLGFHICQLSDGPTGIPLKKSHFQCSS